MMGVEITPFRGMKLFTVKINLYKEDKLLICLNREVIGTEDILHDRIEQKINNMQISIDRWDYIVLNWHYPT